MDSNPSTPETKTQEQARLRRERRAAKIQAGGSNRLQAITSLQGGRDPALDVAPPPVPNSTPPPAYAAPNHPDPAEIDISQHFYTPQTGSRSPPYNGPSATPPPFPQHPPPGDTSQDPMMALMQQMMGGAGGPGGAQGGDMPDIPGLPPGFANILKGMQEGQGQDPPASQSSAYIWRIIHALFSLSLAIYIVLQTPFNGSKLARSATTPAQEDWTVDSSPPETVKHFFYAFATFEVIAQSSRYFIEKGQLPGSGFLGSVAQILPEPYAGYVRVVGRYSVIWRTVVTDAMVVVFVLGMTGWWRGGVPA